MSHLGVEGKVALVTGAAQGIGMAVTKTFLEQGVTVAMVDRHAGKLNERINEFENEGFHGAAAFPGDVSDSAAVNKIVHDVESVIGPIDILVNVAGILKTKPVAELTDADWEETFSVNCNGVFHVSREVSKYMIPRRRGSIVTVGSNAAGVPRINMSAYAASKAAATQFTKCLGLELAEHQIRCNIVSPGSTETPMQRSFWSDGNGAQRVIAGSQDLYRIGIPLKKMAAPGDIAEAVLFLASNRAGHITMHDLRVDGGATLGC